MKLTRTALAVTAVALACAAACSTFSGDNGSENSVDASIQEDSSIVAVDGSTDSSAQSDSGVAVDPCAGQSDSYEFAGLYVLGGRGVDDGGAFTEPKDILRAGIHCDGSLDSWVTVGILPSPNAGHDTDGREGLVAGALGQQILLVGGQTSLGGVADTTSVLDWAVQSDGGLASPTLSTGSVVDTNIFQAAATTVGSVLVVAGGDIYLDGGATGPTDHVSLWQVINGQASTFGQPAPLPVALERSGAATVGNDVYVISGASFVGTLSGGTLQWQDAGTHNDFDFGMVSVGKSLVIVGGNNLPKTLTVYSLNADRTLGAPQTTPLPQDITHPCAAVARGIVYSAGTSYPPYNVVISASIGASGVATITTEPPLPEPRWICTAVVVPLAN